MRFFVNYMRMECGWQSIYTHFGYKVTAWGLSGLQTKCVKLFILKSARVQVLEVITMSQPPPQEKGAMWKCLLGVIGAFSICKLNPLIDYGACATQLVQMDPC